MSLTGGLFNSGLFKGRLFNGGIFQDSSTNQAIRLGDSQAVETVFTGYWPTTGSPSDYIKISPHVTAANGDKVWKFA